VPRRRRASSAAGLAVSAVAAITAASISARAQSLPPPLNLSTDLFAPPPGANPPAAQSSFGTATLVLPAQAPASEAPPAPSRIGATPSYGTRPGFGAGTTGFDSTNTGLRGSLAQSSVGGPPSQSPAYTTFEPVPNLAAPPQPPKSSASPEQPPQVEPLKAAQRHGATLPPPPEPLPVSNPPAQVYPAAAADRPGASLPVPPAIDFAPYAGTPPPGTPPLNTLPLGTQPRRLLPIAAGDPYAALGLQVGSFTLFPSVDLSAGYNTNPEQASGAKPSSLFVVAPELRLQSDWSRHSLTADIQGSYYAYGADLSPSLDVPYLNSTIDGRIDVRHDTQVLLENRFLLATENPGSPNVQVGLARLPINTDIGGTVGLAHEFNRLQVTIKGLVDRNAFDNSTLTDGEIVSNAERNYNQYGGSLRLGYELDPGLKPFVEIDGDERVYDQEFDSFGEQRNSTGTSVEVGSDVNLFGSLTGEMATGYLERVYKDPTLPNIGGVIVNGSLIWQATALTTAKLTAASTVTESAVPGTSGEFSRDFNIQVDHAFLPWIIGTLQGGYGHDDYVGLDRQDNRYFALTGLTYKLSRDLQAKGTVRQDWLTSNVTGVAYNATSFLLGLRLQR
jgi:hypothetical protein